MTKSQFGVVSALLVSCRYAAAACCSMCVSVFVCPVSHTAQWSPCRYPFAERVRRISYLWLLLSVCVRVLMRWRVQSSWWWSSSPQFLLLPTRLLHSKISFHFPSPVFFFKSLISYLSYSTKHVWPPASLQIESELWYLHSVRAISKPASAGVKSDTVLSLSPAGYSLWQTEGQSRSDIYWQQWPLYFPSFPAYTMTHDKRVCIWFTVSHYEVLDFLFYCWSNLA